MGLIRRGAYSRGANSKICGISDSLHNHGTAGHRRHVTRLSAYTFFAMRKWLIRNWYSAAQKIKKVNFRVFESKEIL